MTKRARRRIKNFNFSKDYFRLCGFAPKHEDHTVAMLVNAADHFIRESPNFQTKSKRIVLALEL